MQTRHKLIFGIAWSFREPAIVLLGSSVSLRRFAEFLHTLAGQGTYRPDFIRWANAELQIVVAEGPCSLTVADGVVTWTLGLRMLPTYVQQIESVASCSKACHIYVDAGVPGDWTLLVSMDEYSKDIFE
jgi:hypothetical protein